MILDADLARSTAYHRQEFSRRKRVAVDHRRLYLVAPEDLILSKLEWAKDSRRPWEAREQLETPRPKKNELTKLSRR